jgi:hypothetical protein
MRALVFLSVIPRFLSLVFRELHRESPDLQADAIAIARDHRRVALESGGPWGHISLFSDFLRQHGLDASPNLEYLELMEEQFGQPNLYLFAAADWFAKDYPHNRMLRFLELAFRFMMEEWDRNQPDLVVAEGIDCGLSHALYAIATKRGVPFIVPAPGRFPGRISLIRNPHDRWERAEALMADYLVGGIPADARLQAEQYVHLLRKSDPQITDLVSVDRSQVVRQGDLAYFGEIFQRYFEDCDNYHGSPPWTAIGQRMGRVWRTRWARARYSVPPRGEKYVLFPLHVQPEATTLTLAPFLVDQPSVVENIAKSLPIGHYVYVKEHRYGVGRRPLDEYRRIARIPNARLLGPEAPVRELILGSSAVVTITGTMGLEALIYRKPAVTLGRPFYDASGLSHPVGDMRDLPHVFRQATVHNPLDEERLVTFLAAAFQSSFPGQVGYERVSPREAFSAGNVARFANELRHEMENSKAGRVLATGMQS